MVEREDRASVSEGHGPLVTIEEGARQPKARAPIDEFKAMTEHP
jgi:hypothetical protein